MSLIEEITLYEVRFHVRDLSRGSRLNYCVPIDVDAQHIEAMTSQPQGRPSAVAADFESPLPAAQVGREVVNWNLAQRRPVVYGTPPSVFTCLSAHRVKAHSNRYKQRFSISKRTPSWLRDDLSSRLKTCTGQAF